jgi:hypothetical protein
MRILLYSDEKQIQDRTNVQTFDVMSCSFRPDR